MNCLVPNRVYWAETRAEPWISAGPRLGKSISLATRLPGAESNPPLKSQERSGASPYRVDERSLSLPAIRPDAGSLGPHFSADLHPLLGEVPPSQ
jgi:hypothetical protein